MKFYILGTIFTLFTITAFAQDARQVIIEPGGLNAIEAAIEADLINSDTATVEATTYILRRDAIYPYDTQWQPTYFIHLEAEEGEGARPVMLGVHPASGEAPRFIRVVDGFTFRGIDFPGFDSAGEHSDNAPIRPRGVGSTVIVDDCIFDDHRFEIMRTDAVDLKVYFLNNLVRNNFQRDRWVKNGGVFFQRGNPVDTMVLRNNTMINTTGRIFHEVNGEAINYLEMTHNTVVNAGGLREFFEYGGVNNTAVFDFGSSLNLKVQNNIFYNVGFFGILEEWQDEAFIFNFNNTDSTESVVITNNNIFTEEALMTNLPDTAVNMMLLSPDLDSLIGEEAFLANNISEQLDFDNAAMNTEIFAAAKMRRWENPETSWLERLDLEDEIDNNELDYGYSEETVSYNAGVGGVALGAMRWFDEEAFVSTKRYVETPSVLALKANYPNPLRTQTTIRFDLAQPAAIQIAIFDITGKEVYRTAREQFAAGTDQLLELNDLRLNAGLYVYRLLADTPAGKVGATANMVVK